MTREKLLTTDCSMYSHNGLFPTPPIRHFQSAHYCFGTSKQKLSPNKKHYYERDLNMKNEKSTKRNSIEVTADGNEIVIRMPIILPPAPSTSGKTLIVASTRGFYQSTARL